MRDGDAGASAVTRQEAHAALWREREDEGREEAKEERQEFMAHQQRQQEQQLSTFNKSCRRQEIRRVTVTKQRAGGGCSRTALGCGRCSTFSTAATDHMEQSVTFPRPIARRPIGISLQACIHLLMLLMSLPQLSFHASLLLPLLLRFLF